MKRTIDIFAALGALVVLSPVLLALALLVRWKLGPKPLFWQRRPGLHGRTFDLVKFRTMTDARGADGCLLPDAERLTPFGRFLRATSLDELPELWNVLRGDMSFVGPRPLLVEYLDRYTPEQARRHEVRPGITGWAQVNGRNAQTWDQRFRFDVWYVDNWTPWLDLKILLLTVWKVVCREGVSDSGHVTKEAFLGRRHDGPVCGATERDSSESIRSSAVQTACDRSDSRSVI